MLQRGRKSAAYNNVVALDVTGAPPCLTPPPSLTKAERAQFKALIDASHPNHFRASDVPLLVTLAQGTLMARKLGRDPKRVVEWERVTRVQMALMTKLRLTPQSRQDPKTTGRMMRSCDGDVAPWHGGTDDDKKWSRGKGTADDEW